MSLMITTSDYQRITQTLVDTDSMEDAKLLYEFHGPFELTFAGEQPEWYN